MHIDLHLRVPAGLTAVGTKRSIRNVRASPLGISGTDGFCGALALPAALAQPWQKQARSRTAAVIDSHPKHSYAASNLRSSFKG